MKLSITKAIKGLLENSQKRADMMTGESKYLLFLILKGNDGNTHRAAFLSEQSYKLPLWLALNKKDNIFLTFSFLILIFCHMGFIIFK